MASWDAIRAVQEMCERLRASEAEWSSQHFAELKQPRWLLLKRMLQTPPNVEASFSAGSGALAKFQVLQPRVLSAWERWLSTTRATVDPLGSLPPASLAVTPAPLGLLVLSSIGKTTTTTTTTTTSGFDQRWILEFAKKPADIQLLLWLHLLTLKPPSLTREAELAIWNAVTVIQNSPLPFIARAKLTVLAYRHPLTLPVVALQQPQSADDDDDGRKFAAFMAVSWRIGTFGRIGWSRRAVEPLLVGNGII